MSYYGHPFFQPAFVQVPQGQQGRQQQLQLPTQQQQPRVASPSIYDLQDEERQALAYLRSVQRRREAAEAAAALEARQHAQALVEREAALRAAAERHQQLVAAARRERAIRETLARERAREQALAQAIAQRRQEQVQAAVEAERRRQIAAAEAYARAIKEQEERARRAQAQQAQFTRQAPQAQTQDTDEEEFDLAGLNQLLGSLFGFNIASGEPSDSQPQADKSAQPSQTTPAPAQQSPAATPAQPTTEKTGAAESNDKEQEGFSELPADLNQLLQQFLGLQVEPASTNETASKNASNKAVGDAVTNLNDVLGRYGLEFVPDSDGEEEEQQQGPCCGWWMPEQQPSHGWLDTSNLENKNKDEQAKSNDEQAKSNDEQAKSNDEAAPTAPAQTLYTPAAPSETQVRQAEVPVAVPVDKATDSTDNQPKRMISQPDPDAPFTSTLGNYSRLPPYLREILSHVEETFADEHDGHECNCDPSTRTPCTHGHNGQPCETARRRARKERKLQQKLAARRARERHQHKSPENVKEQAAIPQDAPKEEVKEHQSVAEQAAEKAQEIQQHEEVAQQAADKGRGIEQHESVAEDAAARAQEIEQHEAVSEAAAAKGQEFEQHANVAEQAAERAQEIEKHEAVADDAADKGKILQQDDVVAADADTTTQEVQHHRAVYEDAANVGEAVKEHEEVAEDAAAKATEPDHGLSGAPQVHPTLEKAVHVPPKRKNTQDKPLSPEAQGAVKELDTIESKLNSLTSSFQFPSRLAFAASMADATQPPLLFNRLNSSYHGQANELLKLLLKVDSVQSHGERKIRQQRKDLVKKIEAALNDLERKRDDRWEEVKERRDRGESDVEDDWNVSTDVTSDPEQHADDEHEGYTIV